MKTNQKQEFSVKDLREYLDSNGLSPEKFSEASGLSHMTIRRWLKKRNDEKLPPKYAPILAPSFMRTVSFDIPKATMAGAFITNSVDDVLGEIKKAGIEYDETTDVLEKDVQQKLKTTRPDKILVNYCRRLIKVIRLRDVPLKVKAVAIGALLYFINPVDLIPDHLPVIGYLDDLAVLAVTLNFVTGYEKPEDREKLT